MFWSLLTKILVDVVTGLLIELVVLACTFLWKNYRNSSQQVRFA